MMKHNFYLLSALLAALLSVSCSEEETDAPVVQTDLTAPVVTWPLTRAQKDQVRGLNDFAFTLLRNAVSHSDGSSTVLSPLSVAYVLGMAADGANGDTRDEITAALGFRRGDAQGLDDLCASLIRHTRSDGGIMHLANALFVRQGMEMKAQFPARLAEGYDAEISEADFTQEATLTRINSWVNQHTNGMIPAILDRLDPLTAMCLINAVCMKAKWQQPFSAENTRNAIFYFPDLSSDFISTMSMTDEMEYAEVTKGKLLRLPYKGGRYAMNIYLPNENISPLEALGTMSGSELYDMTSQVQYRRVILQMPRITTESDHNLAPLLKKMGIVSAFDREKADFSNITEVDDIFISMARQKALIRVDEEGTEAAAITNVTGGLWADGSNTDLPVTFYANHQFLYFITDKDAGIILFIGTFNGE